MSGIVNKIKEAVHGDKPHHGAPEGTSGPHNSRAANAADPRVDSDRDHSHTVGAGRTAGHGEYGTAGTAEGVHGPHSSRVANAADPRVDSDLDGRGAMGTHTGRTTGTTGTTGGFGSTHTAGTSGLGSTHTAGTGTYGAGTGTAEGTHGPHSSRLANAADPRVDSDRDGRAAGTTGGFGSTHHTAGTTGGLGSTMGAGRTAGHGEYGSSHTGTGASEGTYGPHSSRLANAADPRVDSDRDNRGAAGTTGGFGSTHTAGTSGLGSTHTAGAGTYGAGAGSGATGMTGTHGASAGTYGPHGSRVANAADPRVDSDRDGRGALHGSGPGPAPSTAGPHKSDMANKVDPRVDSDLDGSKTMGGNKTYQSGSTYDRDPTDAAQVPPSVLRKHVGAPSIEHDDHSHHRERRNSIKTHQETFRGL